MARWCSHRVINGLCKGAICPPKSKPEVTIRCHSSGTVTIFCSGDRVSHWPRPHARAGEAAWCAAPPVSAFPLLRWISKECACMLGFFFSMGVLSIKLRSSCCDKALYSSSHLPSPVEHFKAQSPEMFDSRL